MARVGVAPGTTVLSVFDGGSGMFDDLDFDGLPIDHLGRCPCAGCLERRAEEAEGEEPTWRTRDGRILLMRDMEDTHVVHALNFSRRERKHLRTIALLEKELRTDRRAEFMRRLEARNGRWDQHSADPGLQLFLPRPERSAGTYFPRPQVYDVSAYEAGARRNRSKQEQAQQQEALFKLRVVSDRCWCAVIVHVWVVLDGARWFMWWRAWLMMWEELGEAVTDPAARRFALLEID